MKKILLTLLLVLGLTTNVLAGPVNKTIISSTTLDNDPTSVTSTVFNIQDYLKVAFFIYADETDSGNDTSAAVTLEISYDNSTWIATSFYDAAGGATPQTSETLCTGVSTDQDYYFWINKDQSIPYVRVVVTGTGTAAGGDDEITILGYMSGTK